MQLSCMEQVKLPKSCDDSEECTVELSQNPERCHFTKNCSMRAHLYSLAPNMLANLLLSN